MMMSVHPRPQPQANGTAAMTARSGNNVNPKTAIWAPIPRRPTVTALGVDRVDVGSGDSSTAAWGGVNVDPICCGVKELLQRAGDEALPLTSAH